MKRIKSSLSKSLHFSVVSRSSSTIDICFAVCSGKEKCRVTIKKNGKRIIHQTSGVGKVEKLPTSFVLVECALVSMIVSINAN